MDSNGLREESEVKNKSRKGKVLDFAKDTLLATLEYTTVGLIAYAGMEYLIETPNPIIFVAGMVTGNHLGQYVRKECLSKTLKDDFGVFLGSLSAILIYENIVR